MPTINTSDCPCCTNSACRAINDCCEFEMPGCLQIDADLDGVKATAIMYGDADAGTYSCRLYFCGHQEIELLLQCTCIDPTCDLGAGCGWKVTADCIDTNCLTTDDVIVCPSDVECAEDHFRIIFELPPCASGHVISGVISLAMGDEPCCEAVVDNRVCCGCQDFDPTPGEEIYELTITGVVSGLCDDCELMNDTFLLYSVIDAGRVCPYDSEEQPGPAFGGCNDPTGPWTITMTISSEDCTGKCVATVDIGPLHLVFERVCRDDCTPFTLESTGDVVNCLAPDTVSLIKIA